MKKYVKETSPTYAVSHNYKHEKSYEAHLDDHSMEIMSPSTKKGDQPRETLLNEHVGTWGWLKSHEYPSVANEHCAYCLLILNFMLSLVHLVVCLYTTFKAKLLMHYNIVFASVTGERLSKMGAKIQHFSEI